MQIIDTHTFIGQCMPLGIDYRLEHFKRLKERVLETSSGDDLKFMCISAVPNANSNIADVVAENPDLFLGAYLMINTRHALGEKPTSPKEIQAYLKREEIKGLKVITAFLREPIDSPNLEPYVAIAEDFGIPILYHCSKSEKEEFTSFEQKRRLIESHPNLKVILAHFGGLNLNYVKDSMWLARTYENVFLNTTGMSGEAKEYESLPNQAPRLSKYYTSLAGRFIWESILEYAMEDKIVRQKIIFGTDFPSHSYDIHPIDKLSHGDQEQIMHNAKRLFRLEE
jgi:predicted TIM-barrel fold metal-dependent hydrolase